jgi:LmbE family N-acetylglucosaminyl deacetylase
MSTERVLVVSAHPDDEAFGCGGTLLRHLAAGAEVHWVVVTEAWRPKWSQEYLDQVARESLEVENRIAPRRTTRLKLPAARLDVTPLIDIIDPLTRVIADAQPSVVYSVGAHDVNSDHAVVFRALVIAAKPLYASSIERLLTFELPSSTDWAIAAESGRFQPNVFIDISEQMEAKTQLLACYGRELRDPPHPRSIEGIRAVNRVRGGTAGVAYAEAFQLHREIVR